MNNSRSALLFLVFAVIFVDTVGYQIVIPSLPLFKEKLQLTDGEAGVIYASYGIASLLFYIPFGALVDRFGRKVFIILGLLLLFISSLFFAISNTFYELLISRTLQGISAASTWAGSIPFVADVSEKGKTGVSMSGIGIAYSLGVIFGPAIGGAGGLKTPFYLFLLAPVLLIFPFLFVKEFFEKRDKMKISVQLIFRNSGLLIACLSISVCFFALGALEVILPIHLYRLQGSKMEIGLGFAVLGLVSSAFQFISGWWSDRRGRIEPILFGLLLGAFVVPFFGAIERLWVWLIIFIPLAFAFASALAPTLPLIADSVPEQKLGFTYGIYNTFFSLALIAGSIIIPLLTQSYGLKPALYTISFYMFCAVFVVYIVFRRL